MTFGISILASRTRQSSGKTDVDVDVEHTGCMVVARSEAEAEGLGMRLVRELFPASEGWANHHVRAWPSDRVFREADIEAATMTRRSS
jgi:hypothetical protein